MTIQLIHGSATSIPVPDKSVHCVVTSPPYWGLRAYTGDDQKCTWDSGWEGGLGLEPTPELYTQNIVEVFREIKRVLRDDGTVWLNIGDSYNGSGGAGGDYNKGGMRDGQTRYPGRNIDSLKPKDLVGVPWRVAFALQSDGWYLRNEIIWHSPNKMPEGGARDRCSRDHETVFLLSKKPHYYYDINAIRVPHKTLEEEMQRSDFFDVHDYNQSADETGKVRRGRRMSEDFNIIGRNERTVWSINTVGYSGSHSATFPPDLPEKCIKAGTSERGVCPKCLSPWKRVVKREFTGEYNKEEALKQRERMKGVISGGLDKVTLGRTNDVKRFTEGWEATCECVIIDTTTNISAIPDPIPATVLDPFCGSGTTVMVARNLGRSGIGVDISAEYLVLAEERTGVSALEEWEDGQIKTNEVELVGLLKDKNDN